MLENKKDEIILEKTLEGLEHSLLRATDLHKDNIQHYTNLTEQYTDLHKDNALTCYNNDQVDRDCRCVNNFYTLMKFVLFYPFLLKTKTQKYVIIK